MILYAVAIASTAHMDDDEKLRNNSDDDSSTEKSKDNGNYAIDIQDDQEYNDESKYNSILVFETYCHHHI